MSTDIIAGKYQLIREIGRGAMGEIWEAQDLHLRRRVALKLMSPALMASGTARARFDREARAIAQLHNPHVVQIYDYGIDGNSPYIVMEFLEGEDLETRLARVQRIPLAALVPIVTQAALALGAAHTKGIVHREHKPPPRNPAPDTGAPPISSDPAELRGRGLPRIPPHCPARAPFGGKTMATATAREFSGVTASRWASERHTARFAILSANGPRVPWPAVYHLRRSAPSRAMTAAAAG